MQRPLYFTNKGELIAGTLHLPARLSRCPAVAVLHGFTGTRCEPNFIFVRLSRRLAEEGIASLRFDFRGSGESDGEFEDMTPLEEVSDARAALRQLGAMKRVDVRRLGLVGLSMGGLVAALTAAKEPSVRSVALWSAVARPRRVFEAMTTKRQRSALLKTGRLDVGGLCVGRAFLEATRRLDPPSALAKSRASALIIHGTGDETVPYSDSTVFLRSARARDGIRTERFAVKGADHVYSSVPWRDAVVEATVGWFKETL